MEEVNVGSGPLMGNLLKSAMIYALHIPKSLVATAGNGSLIAAWAGLFFGLVGTILALRREFLERVHLTFRFKATFIEEDDPNADGHLQIDGVPSVEAVIATVTNAGRGVTIEQCRCEYEAMSTDGIRVEKALTYVGEHIEKGKACEGRLKIYRKPIRFRSATAIDSTGKVRHCSPRELIQLNNESEEWWQKTHFQKERSWTDKKLAERQREQQQAKLQAETVAAQEAAKAKERQTELRRKLFNLMRKIDCIECDFHFPPNPTGAVFNANLIRQINQSIERIQDALMELADLTETKVILEVTIPCPVNAPWDELQRIYEASFKPVQVVFGDLKKEVRGVSQPGAQ